MKQTNILIKMVLDRWNGSIQSLNKHLAEMSDEQLQQEIAPTKNRGTYVLGHLIAVHDDMLMLLDKGPKRFPQLQQPFIEQADRIALQTPSAAELRDMWTKQNEVLRELFSGMSADEWFSKHTAVSEEDFVKEPHRNKLNIIVTRTSHLQYHSGQMVLLKR